MFNCVEKNLWCNSPFAEQKYKHARGHTVTLTHMQTHARKSLSCKGMREGYCFHWNKSLIITHHAREGPCFRAYKAESYTQEKNNVILITLINKKKSTIIAEPLYFWRHSTSHSRIHHCNPFMFLSLSIFAVSTFFFRFQFQIVELAVYTFMKTKIWLVVIFRRDRHHFA